jgi:hypothetical protein
MQGPPSLGARGTRASDPTGRQARFPFTKHKYWITGTRAMIGNDRNPPSTTCPFFAGDPLTRRACRQGAALTPPGGGAGHNWRGGGTTGDERIGGNHLLDRRTYCPIYHHSLGQSAKCVPYHCRRAHTWQFSSRRISVKN